MNLIARLLGKGVEVNPDVKPKTVLEKSVVKFWLWFALGSVIEWALGKLAGVEAPWVPWAMGALRGVLDVVKASYKVDPSTPPEPAGPP